MNIYFSENIKKLRKESKLTQEKLAEYLSVSFQAVSKWERGVSPNKRILETIHETPACVKGITIEYYIF